MSESEIHNRAEAVLEAIARLVELEGSFSLKYDAVQTSLLKDSRWDFSLEEFLAWFQPDPVEDD